MRFAPVAVSRRERMDQSRQDRDAARPLRAAFPTVQRLRIALKFAGPGPSVPTAQSHLLYPPARAFFEYPCPYSDCSGQFDLADAVNVAMSSATHQAEGVLECGGSRGSDQGAKRPCSLRVAYEVSALLQPQG